MDKIIYDENGKISVDETLENMFDTIEKIKPKDLVSLLKAIEQISEFINEVKLTTYLSKADIKVLKKGYKMFIKEGKPVKYGVSTKQDKEIDNLIAVANKVIATLKLQLTETGFDEKQFTKTIGSIKESTEFNGLDDFKG